VKKQPTQNTVAKKRAGQEDVDFDCHFDDFLLRAAFRSKDKANLNRRVRPDREKTIFASLSGGALPL
jgi:hypothetical protein